MSQSASVLLENPKAKMELRPTSSAVEMDPTPAPRRAERPKPSKIVELDENRVMIPVLLPHKFDFVQVTYARLEQEKRLKQEHEDREARMQGKLLRFQVKDTDAEASIKSANSSFTPTTLNRSLKGSRSASNLSRPPSAKLFVPDVFANKWEFK